MGWRFYSCDSSIVGRCSVMLVRNPDGVAWWQTLSDVEQDDIHLYVSGTGGCMGEALDNAIKEAKEAVNYDDWCTSQETPLPVQ